jgi:hypothetical protein
MSLFQPNQFGGYVRFGDWPEDERSQNHAAGWKEEGVSVYDLDNHMGAPQDPDPDWQSDGAEWAKDGMHNRMTAALGSGRWTPHTRGHIVKGDVVGTGWDGEPLLRNVKKVGDWPEHVHRWAPGEQLALFPERVLQPKQHGRS